MPRAVPEDLVERRRERLAELIEAIGEVRGRRVTQRDFSAHIGREQGTIAAILGGHRALGGDVLNAILMTWGLPADAFDAESSPDFRALVRSATAKDPAERGAPRSAPTTDHEPAVGRPTTSGPRCLPKTEISTDLAEVLDVLSPDRPVDMALRWLARRGLVQDADGWASQAIAAQGALARGELPLWFDDVLTALTRRGNPASGDASAPRSGQRTVVVHTGSGKSSRLSRA